MVCKVLIFGFGSLTAWLLMVALSFWGVGISLRVDLLDLFGWFTVPYVWIMLE